VASPGRMSSGEGVGVEIRGESEPGVGFTSLD